MAPKASKHLEFAGKMQYFHSMMSSGGICYPYGSEPKISGSDLIKDIITQKGKHKWINNSCTENISFEGQKFKIKVEYHGSDYTVTFLEESGKPFDPCKDLSFKWNASGDRTEVLCPADWELTSAQKTHLSQKVLFDSSYPMRTAQALAIQKHAQNIEKNKKPALHDMGPSSGKTGTIMAGLFMLQESAMCLTQNAALVDESITAFNNVSKKLLEQASNITDTQEREKITAEINSFSKSLVKVEGNDFDKLIKKISSDEKVVCFLTFEQGIAFRQKIEKDTKTGKKLEKWFQNTTAYVDEAHSLRSSYGYGKDNSADKLRTELLKKPSTVFLTGTADDALRDNCIIAGQFTVKNALMLNLFRSPDNSHTIASTNPKTAFTAALYAKSQEHWMDKSKTLAVSNLDRTFAYVFDKDTQKEIEKNINMFFKDELRGPDLLNFVTEYNQTTLDQIDRMLRLEKKYYIESSEEGIEKSIQSGLIEILKPIYQEKLKNLNNGILPSNEAIIAEWKKENSEPGKDFSIISFYFKIKDKQSRTPSEDALLLILEKNEIINKVKEEKFPAEAKSKIFSEYFSQKENIQKSAAFNLIKTALPDSTYEDIKGFIENTTELSKAIEARDQGNIKSVILSQQTQMLKDHINAIACAIILKDSFTGANGEIDRKDVEHLYLTSLSHGSTVELKGNIADKDFSKQIENLEKFLTESGLTKGQAKAYANMVSKQCSAIKSKISTKPSVDVNSTDLDFEIKEEDLKNIGFQQCEVASDGSNEAGDKNLFKKSSFGLIHVLILDKNYSAGISQKSLMNTAALFKNPKDIEESADILQLLARPVRASHSNVSENRDASIICVFDENLMKKQKEAYVLPIDAVTEMSGNHKLSIRKQMKGLKDGLTDLENSIKKEKYYRLKEDEITFMAIALLELGATHPEDGSGVIEKKSHFVGDEKISKEIRGLYDDLLKKIDVGDKGAIEKKSRELFLQEKESKLDSILKALNDPDPKSNKLPAITNYLLFVNQQKAQSVSREIDSGVGSSQSFFGFLRRSSVVSGHFSKQVSSASQIKQGVFQSMNDKVEQITARIKELCENEKYREYLEDNLKSHQKPLNSEENEMPVLGNTELSRTFSELFPKQTSNVGNDAPSKIFSDLLGESDTDPKPITFIPTAPKGKDKGDVQAADQSKKKPKLGGNTSDC